MARSIRVKVAVADLITKIEAAKVKLVVDHEKALKKYAADVQKYLGSVEDALIKALDEVQNGVMPKANYYSNRIEIATRASRPSKPSLSTARLDSDLGLLRAATDETLSISGDDGFARYL